MTSDGTLSYTWDAEGRMTSATGPLGNTDTMTYNALGERVTASFPDGSYTDTHIYPRDIFGRRLEIFESRPRTGWYGADQWWARVGGVRLQMGGSTSWLLHTDALDSTTMVTDQTGAVSGDVAYDPWGNLIAGGGSNGDAFAGLEYQINQVLPPSATRDYNPNFGRWMTPDPGGRKVVNLANPQTWNMYAYTTDNPTTLNDPSGLQTDAEKYTCANGGNFCQGLVREDSTKVAAAAADEASQNTNNSLHYKKRVPPASGALKKMLGCTQGCTGSQLTVTSTSDEVIRGGRVVAHGSNTPHGRGEAADVRANRGDANTILNCAAGCGAKFGLNEVTRHPAGTITTGGHVHLQITPGRNGGRGDLPPALMPSHTVPDPEPPHPVADHSD